MDTREQRLIDDVLKKANLTELPKPANKKSVCIEGVAKIRLNNNSIGYGIVKRNQDLSYRVVYINGDTAAIHEIEEIYPYITLQKEYIKKFGKAEKEDARIKYLRSLDEPCFNELNLEEMTIDELNLEVVKAAIMNQLKDMAR